MAVLHQHMDHEAEPCLLAAALAEQPGVRIGGQGMAVVGPPLAVKVPARVAPATGRIVPFILGPKALQGRPRLDQGAVDREVLAAQQAPDLRVIQDRRQQPGRHLAREQPVAVGGERGRVPHRIVDPEAHKPAEQKIVVQLLHEQPLRAAGLNPAIQRLLDARLKAGRDIVNPLSAPVH